MTQIKGRLKCRAKGLSQRYASPEAFRILEECDENKNATIKDTVIDIYAFGIILWELLERRSPWDGQTYTEIRKNVLNGERPKISEEVEYSQDKLVLIMIQVLKKAWIHDPTQRPTFHQILQDLQLTYYLQLQR